MALLVSIFSCAANPILITASDNASYSDGDALFVDGLSATELDINDEISLIVYWDGTGGSTTGYGATLSHSGELLRSATKDLWSHAIKMPSSTSLAS